MMVTRRLFLSKCMTGVAGAAACTIGFSSAQARNRNRDDHDRVRDDVRRGRLVPMKDVVKRIRRRTDGRLMDAFHDRRKQQYRIVWRRNNGEVQHFIVDARTGRILSVRRRQSRYR